MALFGKKKSKEEGEKKKEGFFARFRKKKQTTPESEAQESSDPSSLEIEPPSQFAVEPGPSVQVAHDEGSDDVGSPTVKPPVDTAPVTEQPRPEVEQTNETTSHHEIDPNTQFTVEPGPPVGVVHDEPEDIGVETGGEESPAKAPGVESAEVHTEAHQEMDPNTPFTVEPGPGVQVVHEETVEEAKPEKKSKFGFLKKLKDGLKKTRDSLKGRLDNLFLATRKIDEDLLEEIEEMLIGSDIGVQTTMDIIDTIRRDVDRKTLKNGEDLKGAIKSQLLTILESIPNKGFDLDKNPTVMLIVGVNGVGKTTTIGKLANQFRLKGKKVCVCAADTFRAAAVEQLQVWAGRADVDIVLKEGTKDPASVVFDALERVKETGADVLLIDTAGRLHNNPNLMNELEKIRRITTRSFPDAPHNVCLILDAVTGQNGLQQAKQFVQKVGVTDLVLTKMDGTAKGGIAIAIANELNMPIQYVGVGEQMDDLLPFDPKAFVNSLFEGD